MIDETKVIQMLKDSEFSDKAIEYYMKKVNVGVIENPSTSFVFTGPCGDSVEIYLKIENNIITDAKFQSTGCAGSFVGGSAITEMIKGKTIEEAKKFNEKDIMAELGGLPKSKIHCASLIKITMDRALQEYQNK